MSNLTVNGTNLDIIFDSLGGLTKRADVGIRSGGSDISNRFAAAADGTAYGGTTNFRSGGSDIGPLFAEIGTVLYPGALWTWGNNAYGQLGDNTRINRSSPVQTVAAGTNWKPVACGDFHTSSIKTDGRLWIWGFNYGQLGDNTGISRSSPVQTVSGGTNWKQVACGLYHTAAIKTDGTLWAWGYNGDGPLGDNTRLNNRSSPVQTVAAGTNWKLVACGQYHTAAIKTDGTLWIWGNNSNGQLGDNTITNRSSPVQTVAAGTNWKQVTCSGIHTAAIKTDGTLWMWGKNQQGQLGDNTITNRSSPVQTVAAGTNWRLVAGGSYHTSAIKTDGTLWSWGYNVEGALGDNTTTFKSSPVQTVSGGTNWKLTSSGGRHRTSIKTDGTLWTWGYNSDGQLGDNTIINKSSPVQTVAGGTNWKQVAGGNKHAAGIR